MFAGFDQLSPRSPERVTHTSSCALVRGATGGRRLEQLRRAGAFSDSLGEELAALMRCGLRHIRIPAAPGARGSALPAAPAAALNCMLVGDCSWGMAQWLFCHLSSWRTQSLHPAPDVEVEQEYSGHSFADACCAAPRA